VFLLRDLLIRENTSTTSLFWTFVAVSWEQTMMQTGINSSPEGTVSRREIWRKAWWEYGGGKQWSIGKQILASKFHRLDDDVIGGTGHHGDKGVKKGFWIAIYDPKTWSRLVLPLPTDGANCTCKKVRVKNTRVVLYSRV